MALDIQLVGASGDAVEFHPITESEFNEMKSLIQESEDPVLLSRIKDYYEDAGWKRNELSTLKAEIKKLLSCAEAQSKLLGRKAVRKLEEFVDKARADRES